MGLYITNAHIPNQYMECADFINLSLAMSLTRRWTKTIFNPLPIYMSTLYFNG